jgi:hypothetical protein
MALPEASSKVRYVLPRHKAANGVGPAATEGSCDTSKKLRSHDTSRIDGRIASTLSAAIAGVIMP